MWHSKFLAPSQQVFTYSLRRRKRSYRRYEFKTEQLIPPGLTYKNRYNN